MSIWMEMQFGGSGAKGKTDSRRYAKRQLTWFNSDKDIRWFHPDDEEEIINFVNLQLNIP